MSSAVKVLIVDLFSKEHLAVLKQKGFNVHYDDKLKKDTLRDFIAKFQPEVLKQKGFNVHYDDKLKKDTLRDFIAKFQPEVLVVRSTNVTAEHLAAGSGALKAIIRAGSGVDTIDIKSASELGVQVGNCPGKNADSVAETVLGLILAIDRRIPDGVADLRGKKWNRTAYLDAPGLKGKSLGIVGFGAIGREVAKRAAAFGMKINASDPFAKKQIQDAGYSYCGAVDELLAVSDIVTLHVPSIPSTKHMINKRTLAIMKKDAVLINTARADVVVDADLLQHLKENPNFRYGADVFTKEPAEKTCFYENQLAMHRSTVGTHHIGGSSAQAEEAVGDEALRMILEFAATSKLPNMVNKITTPVLDEIRPRL